MTDQTRAFYECTRLAEMAAQADEVPIGVVMVKDGKIISGAHNETEKQSNFLAHAEMIAIKRATKFLNTKYLNDCELYSTLEPCPMCMAAARLSRIKSIFYLISSDKFGADGKALYSTHLQKIENHSESDKILNLLRSFFEKKR
ncbi:MAG: tRNA-specific adenosine deaminase [Deltaproteobacteria bacterium CG11_big_fil_rev_8_21_14_0_20_45_16]|nr:MAG: tRNA-specific adenosine deaminase [Deltaproteobacteria bacterium CG11_big_fil_rev_8_21_14_0_20_45_16]